MSTVTLMKPPPVSEIPKKRVAAYARVSKDTERLNHSLAAQVSYYSNYIQSNPNWEFAGVYIDRYITGTLTKDRESFNRLIADCEAGKIDLILVKSVSRFTRRTVDLLTTTRRLKALGVEVYFEEQNISSFSPDGEFLLTVIVSSAEEEIRNISTNIKWTFRTRFEQGIPHHHFKILGYDWEGDKLVINDAEAEIVKRIYSDYLSGSSIAEIERALEHRFPYHVIRFILLNETYTGTLIMQRYYISDPITKKCKTNHGERCKYKVVGNHDAIIDLDTFDRVQREITRRAERRAIANKYINTPCLTANKKRWTTEERAKKSEFAKAHPFSSGTITCFTGKLQCGCCGNNLRRNHIKSSERYSWGCRTGKKNCGIRWIREDEVKRVAAEALGLDKFDEKKFTESVDRITILSNDELKVHFKDGINKTLKWNSKRMKKDGAKVRQDL